MRFRSRRSVLWLTAAIIVAASDGSPSRAEDGPAQFEAVVDACSRYDQLTRNQVWREVARIDVSDVDAFEVEGGSIEPAHVQGQPVLRMTSDGSGATLGLPVRMDGDVAVAMRARTISQRLCDLTIFTDGVSEGPGVQFGGHNNTRNALWTDGADTAVPNEKFVQVTMPSEQRIQHNVWHRVRLEVSDGAVRGEVDGRPLGTVRLSDAYDAKQQRQPVIYWHATTVELAEVVVMQRQEQTVPQAAAAWEQAFGGRTEAQVRGALQQLAQQLDADDWSQRQRCQDMLIRAGALARPIVEPLVRNGSPEQQWRAATILEHLPRRNDDTLTKEPTP